MLDATPNIENKSWNSLYNNKSLYADFHNFFFAVRIFLAPRKKKTKRSSRLRFSKERRRRRRIGSNREQAALIRIPVPGRRIDVYRACRIHVFPLSEIRHTGMARRNVWKTAKGIAFGRSVKLGMVVSRLVDDLSAFLLSFLSPFLFSSIPLRFLAMRGYRLDSRNVVATLLHFRVRLIGRGSGNVRIVSREERGGRVGKGCQP